MKAGKLSSEVLQRLVLSKTGIKRSDVLLGAAIGEDSAVIDFGEEVCVVSTDPITGAVEGIGELAVHVSCNDIAANGAYPLGVQVLILLPEDAGEELVGRIMDDVDRACRTLEIQVLGGHTEITSKVTDVIVAVTAIGRTTKDKFVSSAGAQEGDSLVVTKGIGIEGTAVILQEFAHRLPEAMRYDPRHFFTQLSVVREGVLAAEFGVHAMHDITEGGLIGACAEIATAAGLGFELQPDDIPVAPITQELCRFLGIDPLRLLSSGAMLIACPQHEDLIDFLGKKGIKAFAVGKLTGDGRRRLCYADGRSLEVPSFVQDELWRLYEKYN